MFKKAYFPFYATEVLISLVSSIKQFYRFENVQRRRVSDGSGKSMQRFDLKNYLSAHDIVLVAVTLRPFVDGTRQMFLKY